MSATVFGVDRVSLSYWVLDARLPKSKLSAAPWDQESFLRASDGVVRGVYKGSVTVGDSKVFVRLRESSGGRVGVGNGQVDSLQWDLAPYSVWLDWNPSKQVYGAAGGELLAVEDLQGAAREVIGALSPLVDIADPVGDGRLTRLDLTRDFRSCEDVSWVLGLLSVGSESRAIRGRDGEVETVYWNSGPRSCRVMAYNKGRQMRTGRDDWLRTEVRCGTPWLKNGRVTTLGGLDAGQAGSVGREHWSESGLGTTMKTTEREIVRELMHRGMSDKSIMSFLGWCVCRDIAGGPEVSHSTLAKYRRLEKSLGGVDLTLKSAENVRLDLDSGTVVREKLAS